MSQALSTRTAELLALLAFSVPGDFAYDLLSRWMRAQQLHTLVAVCSLAALLLNVGVNLLLASPQNPSHAVRCR